MNRGTAGLDPAANDQAWGRVSGAAPPLPWKAPLVFVGLVGALLTLVVLSLVRTPGPMDERTFADQRNGLLAGGPQISASVAGVRFGRHPVVLLFVRSQPAARDVRAWSASLPAQDLVRIVVQAPGRDGEQAGVPVVHDPELVLARTVDLPRANDHGPGVGYAVIDSNRVVQYATLDPSWAGNGFEVATIAGAIS
jgi:hypothetical protein